MYNPIIFNSEVFKPITIQDIAPYYAISNYGTVINTNTNMQLSAALTNDGYLRVSLHTVDGHIKHFLVHRLVMLTFHPISNPDEMQVNHMEGIKIDNRDEHLEWVTGPENIRHAFRTGLNNNIRENHSKAILSNEQVHYICKCLSEGMDFRDIENSIDVISINKRELIRSIYERKSWITISRDYTFYDYGNRRNLFTEDQAKTICELLSSGHNYLEILTELGYDINSMSKIELQNMNDVISNIRVGRYYSNISKNYTFNSDKRTYNQKFTSDEVHKVCKFLQDGIKSVDIARNLGYNKESMDYKDYRSILGAINRIKRRIQYTDISKNYNF